MRSVYRAKNDTKAARDSVHHLDSTHYKKVYRARFNENSSNEKRLKKDRENTQTQRKEKALFTIMKNERAMKLH
ncbi:MAG: hypothetical protein EAZ92_00040 [Candidatus Kapaibacterium sp.]|nr:MAG: hypothetical protein EAZ92_00040 [Candidatus Kapabacteria bacterium]